MHAAICVKNISQYIQLYFYVVVQNDDPLQSIAYSQVSQLGIPPSSQDTDKIKSSQKFLLPGILLAWIWLLMIPIFGNSLADPGRGNQGGVLPGPISFLFTQLPTKKLAK